MRRDFTHQDTRERIDINDFDSMELDVNDVIEYTVDEKEDFSDANRPIKGICTDIVVNTLLETKESLFEFMKIICDSFTEAIDHYKKKNRIRNKDIFFAFKGGNVLRLISNQFSDELPELANRVLNDFYKKFFKRSDSDFTIYINPSLRDYERIHHDMCMLAYNIQLHIRHILFENPTQFFSFYNYDSDVRKDLLNDYIEQLNNMAEDPESPYYNFKFTDVSIMGEDNNETKQDILLLPSDYIIKEYKFQNDNTSPAVISFNKSLEFTSGDGDSITKFTLVRTKLFFVLTADTPDGTTSIIRGGELIDVSIPHRKDKSIAMIFEDPYHSFQMYSIASGEDKIEFWSYGLELLSEDLEKILFQVAEYPWDDNKYAKRLNRLCYLYFIDLFTDGSSDYDKIRILKRTSNLINSCRRNRNNLEHLQSFNRLVWYYNETCNKSKNTHELEEFRDNININLETLIETMENLIEFKKYGPVIDELYESDIGDVL